MLEAALADIGYAIPPGGGIGPFLLLTLAIGGATAWRTGQAVAQAWGPLWPAAAYTLLLAAAVRFLHYALFGATLLSLASFLVDFAILALVAMAGHRVRRTRLMTERYGWMFARTSPVTWTERPRGSP